MDVRLANIFDLVEKKTREGTLTWDAFAGDYRTQVGSYFIVLRESPITRALGGSGYSLTLYNADGVSIETFDPAKLSESGEKKVATLYDIARRQALRIDESLDEIVKKLKE